MQIIYVANLCCEGRLVSCLEGGYNINGGLVSPFARSVESHVWKLQEVHEECWDSAALEVGNLPKSQFIIYYFFISNLYIFVIANFCMNLFLMLSTCDSTTCYLSYIVSVYD